MNIKPRKRSSFKFSRCETLQVDTFGMRPPQTSVIIRGTISLSCVIAFLWRQSRPTNINPSPMELERSVKLRLISVYLRPLILLFRLTDCNRDATNIYPSSIEMVLSVNIRGTIKIPPSA